MAVHRIPPAYLDVRRFLWSTFEEHNALIQSGGGTGPAKPRQPTRAVPMPDR